jgi:hypothetical protein
MSRGREKGYKPVRTVFVLSFEDPDLEGCEVRCKRVSLGRLKELLVLLEQANAFKDDDLVAGSDSAEEAIALLEKLYSGFAEGLIGWNVLSDDDKPVPPTVAGMLSQDLWFMLKLIEAYLTGMMQAPSSLGKDSPSGAPSPEAPPGLADQSSSLPSSAGPS